ncbi:hypothetical protein FRC07_009826 [Ceratobasidium sp. 392]|nr:hypothetical protein FRC07_009826 [Ceratobasidium sp. 392]
MSNAQSAPSQPALKRSARIAGVQAGTPPPLPQSRRRGRQPKNTPKSQKNVSEEEPQDGESDEQTDVEMDQLAADTSLFGLIPLAERQSIVEQHQRLMDSLGDETIEDFYAKLDRDDYSSDEYKEYDPRTGDVIDLESSEASFAILDEENNEPTQVKHPIRALRQVKAEKAPTAAELNSRPTTKSANASRSLLRSLSDDGSDNESHKEALAMGTGSKRKCVEPAASGRKVSNKARKTSAASQIKQPKAKNPPKQQRRRASSTRRRRSKPVKSSEDEDEVEADSGEEEEIEKQEPLDYFILNVPVGDPTDKNDKAIKPIKIKLRTVNFETYNHKVAAAMDRSVHDLPRLSWKFGDAKMNANTTILQTEDEFETMVERVEARVKAERDRVADELVANHKKGSKSAGKSKVVQNPVEVTLVQKVVAVAKGGRKPAYGGASSSSSGAAKQRASVYDFENEIKSKNICTLETCFNFGGTCWKVKDKETGTTTHKELGAREVQLWANLVAQSKAELFIPPPCVLLCDVRSKKAESKVAGTKLATSSVGASQNVGNPAAQPAGPSSGGGLFRLELDVKAPLLSAWLPTCDQNNRGEPGDKFASLVFGFERLDILRLTDLQGAGPDFLQSLELVQEDGSIKKMTMGMALRLARLVQEDLQVFNLKLAALRNN